MPLEFVFAIHKYLGFFSVSTTFELTNMKRRTSRFGIDRPEFMKFGKYKNKPISELPSDYIEWFCSQVDGCENIKEAMQDVLLARWKAEQKDGAEESTSRWGMSCAVTEDDMYREFRDIVRR